MKKHFTFSSQKQKHILLGLLIVVLAGTAIWLKNSNYAPDPLRSSADEPLIHWAYSTQPAGITLMNSASRYWGKLLSTQIDNWQYWDYVKFNQVEGTNKPPCYLFPEMINFCTVNDSEDGIAYGSYIFWSETGHLVAGGFVLNDYWLNNSESPYSTAAWRNKFLCQQIGWNMGLDFRYEEEARTTSCMAGQWVDEEIPKQQDPDETDMGNVKLRYTSHTDDTSSSGVSAATAKANEYFKIQNFGQLTQTLGDGREIYSMDLGNGFIMQTMVVKAPAAKAPAVKAPSTLKR